MIPFPELFAQLQDLDENETIEAKRGSDVGKSLLETVCAFANEPKLGGGYIVLGVVTDESSLFPTYEVVGGSNSDKVQTDLASQLRSVFNTEVRAQIRAERYEGKTVIVICVAEANSNDKPIYFKRSGLPRGAFRRNGSADVECTEDDLLIFYQGRDAESYDSKVLDDTSWDDVDLDAIAEYRRVLADQPSRAEVLEWDDQELLRAIRCAKTVNSSLRLTLAGLLLFGRASAQRRCLPMTRVDYIRVPGREWIQDPDKKFFTSERRGPLVRIVGQVWSDILDDIPNAFNIPSGTIQRSEAPLVPDRVVREAVVNALMHRDYRTNSPIQIIRYSNRLEFRNPGYSLKSEDLLGQPGSEARNPCVAAVLYEMKLAETKGRGFSIMRERMEKEGLSPPPFDSDRAGNNFTLFLLFHHLLSEDDLRWLARFENLSLTNEERQALIVARELGTMDNRVFRYISGASTPTASKSLRKLREAALLEPKGKGSGTYYVPTANLLEPPDSPDESPPPSSSTSPATGPREKSLSGGVTALSGGVSGLSGGVGPKSEGVPTTKETDGNGDRDLDDSFTETWGPLTERLLLLPTYFRKVPPPLLSQVEGLGKRAKPEDVRSTIRGLCAWKPLSAEQLARILGREQKYITENYLSPMIASNELVYTIPDIVFHMKQAYKVPDEAGTPAPTEGA